MKIIRRPAFGLALSGGAARGLAHIGVLKVLEREGILIDCLSGTSMGGVVAAFYGAGYSADDMQHEALRMGRLKEMIRLVDIRAAERGLLAGEKVRRYLSEQLGELTFADLRLPVVLNAVDVVRGCEVVLRSGLVADAVRATISVPAIFDPLELEGRFLVDGGVLNNLPANHLRSIGAEVILAVDVSVASAVKRRIQAQGEPSARGQVLMSAEAVMMSALADVQLQAARPDLIIYPEIPEEINALNGFTRAAETIRAGEEAAERALPTLQALLRPGLRWPREVVAPGDLENVAWG